MTDENTVWLVYDGECPICKPAANAFKIRQAVGKLVLVNARENHPIMAELKERALSIDEGMVLKFNNQFYHGADALNVCALIGTNSNMFNKLNVIMFRSKTLAGLFYPVFKLVRKIGISAKGVGNVNNLDKS